MSGRAGTSGGRGGGGGGVARLGVLLLLGAIASVLALAPGAAKAQQAGEDDPYEGRPIREVRIVRPAPDGGVAPVREELEQLIRNNLRTLAGRAYRRQAVSGDLVRLNALGRFREVYPRVQLQTDGSVVVVFEVVEQPLIAAIQVVGNRLFTDQDILGGIDLLEGTPVDRFRIDRAARAIEGMYRARGYHRANVTIDEPALEESQIVLFRVNEGERVRVTALRFEGNTSYAAREIRTVVRTRVADFVFRRGPLDEDVLAEDVARIIDFYRDRGHLDVRAGRVITPSPDGREAIVTFIVDEGPQYTLRSVRAEAGVWDGRALRPVGRGLTVFDAEQIAGLMRIKPGDVYSLDKLRTSIRAVREAYAKLGYTEALVDRVEVRDLQRPEVDLLLLAFEGDRYLTGQVEVIGNEITKKEVILRELPLRPDRPLDATAVDDARRRLESLRIFDPGSVRIVLQPPDPAEPSHRDVVVEVRETSTGEFNFGVSASSDLGLVGRVALAQRNFDLFDPPDSVGEFFSGRAFRGAGQRFDVELAPGHAVQTYLVSLSDPHIFGTDYSVSGALFFRTRQFREYDEERYGGSLSLGRSFGTRWGGRITLRNEWVDLSDIDPGAPVDYFRFEDQSRLTGMGLELNRTTVDDRFRPSRGTRLEMAAEQVGLLGGDHDFTKLRAEYSAYFNLAETFEGARTILSLNTRANYIPQDVDDVPVYERYYLGGRTFRGFGTRAVSPIGIRADTMEPGDQVVGGTWSFFLGGELTQPIYEETISIATFVDSGTVSNRIGLDDYRVSVGVGLRLYIPGLSPVPLAFDLAVPILREDTDRRRIFTFFIDVPF